MAWFRRRPTYIERQPGGTFSVTFPDHVIELIVAFGQQLDSILEEDRPELRRLFPTAYTDDAELDAGYQILSRAELVEQRHQDLTQLVATSDGRSLDPEALESWMRVVNNLRLVLGTTLDVSEDERDVPEDDPLFESYQVYHLLGAVLEEIVLALTDTLDD